MAILASFAVPHPPLIIPEVGRGRERAIQATIDAYDEVGRRVADLAPDTLVITTPHVVMYRDYNHISPGRGTRGSFAQFGAGEATYKCAYDQELRDAICAAANAMGLSAGTSGERDASLDHATMIPLHFVWKHWGKPGSASEGKPRPPIVRIGLSGQSPAVHYQLGQCIQKASNVLRRRVVHLASGDLSHKLAENGPYGFSPDGPVFDKRIEEILSTGSFLDLLTLDSGLAERAAECGLRSFQIMAGALDGTPVAAELLSHEGPFGVGYAVAAFTPDGPEGSDDDRCFLEAYEDRHEQDMKERRTNEDVLVRLARATIEAWTRTETRIDPRSPELAARLGQKLPESLFEQRAGCFVSLKTSGQLRGCIGTIQPTRTCLAEEIVANAISACSRDPRFPPVQEDELDELVYDVDVLHEPEPIDSVDELDIHRYGVIVSTSDGRRGLLLPDLDGISSVAEQVEVAARKGGISTSYDDYLLERFEVERHT